MERQKPLDGFEFDDDAAIDDHIHSKSGIDDKIFIFHWGRHLKINKQTTASQLVRQASFVNGLQKAGPKSAMHSHRAINNLP